MTDSVGTRIDYLGHAGFVVDHGGTRVLIDPWFGSAFLESWFPFPDNHHLRDGVLAGRYDALYVSHTHADHLDRDLLGGLPRDLPVLCAAFRSRDLHKVFRRLGFTEVVTLGHRESVELGPGVRATMLLDTSHKEDSALQLDLGGFRFVDLNDCHPKLSELPRDVDLLAAQFSGAMWYPNCYDYGAAEMAAKVAQVRNGLVDTLVRTVAATDARCYLPCAGPPVFLDPELGGFNDADATIFPRWEDVAGRFAAALPEVGVVRVQPGDHVVVDGRTAVPQSSARPAPTDVEAYRARRAAEWQAHQDRPDGEVTTGELDAYFARLVRRNQALLAGYARDVALVAGDRTWTVRVRPEPDGPTVVDGPPPPGAVYEFRMAPRVLRAIVDGDATWEEALLSLRISLRRSPDLFDVTLMGLLRYGETPVVTRQLVLDGTVSDETIERDGVRMQRFCPHVGEDLNHATVTGGRIECPRHHWAWDLATGECVQGGTLPLSVTPLAEPAVSSR